MTNELDERELWFGFLALEHVLFSLHLQSLAKDNSRVEAVEDLVFVLVYEGVDAVVHVSFQPTTSQYEEGSKVSWSTTWQHDRKQSLAMLS